MRPCTLCWKWDLWLRLVYRGDFKKTKKGKKCIITFLLDFRPLSLRAGSPRLLPSPSSLPATHSAFSTLPATHSAFSTLPATHSTFSTLPASCLSLNFRLLPTEMSESEVLLFHWAFCFDFSAQFARHQMRALAPGIHKNVQPDWNVFHSNILLLSWHNERTEIYTKLQKTCYPLVVSR